MRVSRIYFGDSEMIRQNFNRFDYSVGYQFLPRRSQSASAYSDELKASSRVSGHAFLLAVGQTVSSGIVCTAEWSRSSRSCEARAWPLQKGEVRKVPAARKPDLILAEGGATQALETSFPVRHQIPVLLIADEACRAGRISNKHGSLLLSNTHTVCRQPDASSVTTSSDEDTQAKRVNEVFAPLATPKHFTVISSSACTFIHRRRVLRYHRPLPSQPTDDGRSIRSLHCTASALTVDPNIQFSVDGQVAFGRSTSYGTVTDYTFHIRYTLGTFKLSKVQSPAVCECHQIYLIMLHYLPSEIYEPANIDTR
ncbi:uncharacterized protein MYCFIDRAFT_172073 [Pseudocercospora fijiensis CIRAD86]|uniref:Uncharacterized protein n=1 Tax=Pseudocercospora fijiensis (strain CIRAD86) TaxID=383855 RepID=M3ANZ4_PSEFD|nr:uncharacterized protein MYCFIDRAFT_172073 [Pseudocercospora fijiensis CIRAD86]EME86301.1 hypothetical protein MYCFIDRAFT_172073 [Pseudocercospora fijiensis CIRAD86]